MDIKHIILAMGCLVPSAALSAQEAEQSTRRLTLGLDYTTELQTDFDHSNWVNLLELNAELGICKQLALEAKTLSVAKTRGDRILDDLQTFSNIEEDNLTLAPAVLDLRWSSPGGSTVLRAGVRNVNVDYFTSPVTSLFTGSSCGIFPTISACYDIANYPLASMGVDLTQRWGSFTWQASLYNGQGYKRFGGRDNVFRFCPKSDGVFGITAINYDNDNGNYTVGCALHHGLRGGEALGDEAASEEKRTTSCAPYVNVEQPLGRGFSLLAQASINTGSRPECKHYEALGLAAEVGKAECGIIFTNASFAVATERTMEVTASVPILACAYVQPAVHVIRTGGSTHCVALLRLGITL